MIIKVNQGTESTENANVDWNMLALFNLTLLMRFKTVTWRCIMCMRRNG